MHPETQLQVARIEHQQRVVETTRMLAVLRTIAERCVGRHVRRADDDDPHGRVPGDSAQHARAVPRWAM